MLPDIRPARNRIADLIVSRSTQMNMRTTVSQAQIGKLVQRLVIGQYAILVEVSSGRFLHARHSSAFGRNVGNNDIAVRRIFRMIKPPGQIQSPYEADKPDNR